MNVLISCGATWFPIDDVRVISNISSGEMGHLIAKAFVGAGARVTLLEGPVTDAWRDQRVKVIKYRFFDELAQALKVETRKPFDIIIHAAAVSDFKVARRVRAKIGSDKPLCLTLHPVRKLIDEIKTNAPGALLVGFKLSSKINIKTLYPTVKDLFTRCGCDLVVANSIRNGYQGFILDADGDILGQAKTKKDIANRLVRLLL